MFKKGDKVRIRENAEIDVERMRKCLGEIGVVEGVVNFKGGQVVDVKCDCDLMPWSWLDTELEKVSE